MHWTGVEKRTEFAQETHSYCLANPPMLGEVESSTKKGFTMIQDLFHTGFTAFHGLIGAGGHGFHGLANNFRTGSSGR